MSAFYILYQRMATQIRSNFNIGIDYQAGSEFETLDVTSFSPKCQIVCLMSAYERIRAANLRKIRKQSLECFIAF